MTVSMKVVDLSAHSSADELCDDLMLHTFDCDDCINGREDSCAVFCNLRKQIAEAGGPTKGIALAM